MGSIGLPGDPLVKLFLQTEVVALAERAEVMKEKGFEVHLFPFCPVCGKRLLTGSYNPTVQKSLSA